MVQPPAKAAAAPQPRFSVAQNAAGDWIARERHGLTVRVFPTQQAAIHFALFARGDRRATALLTPCP